MTESAENTGAAAVESASPPSDKPTPAKSTKAKPKAPSSKKKAVPNNAATASTAGTAAHKMTTVRFERHIPAPTELPRASLEKSAPWRAESVAKTREIADNLGVTAQIERLTFQGTSIARTAALLAATLEPAVAAATSQNDPVPRSTRDFVSEVRLSLGAPEHDDPVKLAEWKAASAARIEAGEPTYNLRYFDNRTVVGRDSNIRESALAALIGPDAADALSSLPGERGEDLSEGVRREFGALSGKKARELVEQAARYKAGLVDPELNSIEPGFEKERAAPAGDRQAAGDRAATLREEATPDPARDSIGDSTSAEQPRRAQDPKFIPPVPGRVASRYSVGEKGQYFFDRERRKLAFEDKGTRLQTMDASPVVAESLVEIAMSRGWETLVVKGSTEFRREVWLAAELAGAKVVGYDPTPADKLTLEHKLEERGVSHRDAAQRAQTGENTVEPAKEKDFDKPGPDGRKRAPTARAAEAEEEADAAFPNAREGMFAGKVLAHGEAPYKHEKDNSKSYFVRLEDDKGRTTEVWGKDLARGMQDADAKIGDVVTLTRVEQKPVVVKETVRDNAGKAIGVREKDALLNGWDVEKAQAFRTADRSDSLKKHPDLIGAHATMATTVEALANKFPKMATPIREAFREGIAQKIERGEKVNAPKVRVQNKEAGRRQPQERTHRARSAEAER